MWKILKTWNCAKDFENVDLSTIEGLHFHALCEESADALEAVLKVFEENWQMDRANEMGEFGGGHHITKKAMMLKSLLLCVKFQ